jgi:hypothetical protein
VDIVIDAVLNTGYGKVIRRQSSVRAVTDKLTCLDVLWIC